MKYALNIGDVNIVDILSSTVNAETLYPTHPLEDGSFIADTSINLPRAFNIMAMATNDEYASIKEAQFNRQECVLFDGDDYISSVYIASSSKTKDADYADKIPVDVSLVEILSVKSLFSDKKIIPKNPSNSNTIEKGEVQGEEPPKSLLTSIRKAISGGGQ